MPHYLRLIDGIPARYSFDELRAANPNTSFPEEPSTELMAQFGVLEYTRPASPAFDQIVERLVDGDFLKLKGGAWQLPYKVEQLPLEQASANVRGVRGGRLQDSDWTQLADSPADRAAWAAYRAALRDITKQSGFPYAVVWPIAPV